MGLGGSGPGQLELPDVVGAAAYMAGKAHAHRRDHRARRPAHDPADAPRSRPTQASRHVCLLCGTEQHAAQARARRVSVRRPLLHRGLDPGPQPRPPPQPELPRRPAAAAAPHRRRLRPGASHRGVEASTSRLRDRRRPPRPDAGDSTVSTAPAARPRDRPTAVLRHSHCRGRHDQTEHESAALRERAHAACGQLRRRPPGPGGERRHLLRACDGRADVPPARRPGLPRRAHLSAQTDVADGPSSRRPRPSHGVALLLIWDGGGPRAAQIIAKNLAAIGIDVQVQCFPGDEFWTHMLTPGAPWDLAIDG